EEHLIYLCSKEDIKINLIKAVSNLINLDKYILILASTCNIEIIKYILESDDLNVEDEYENEVSIINSKLYTQIILTCLESDKDEEKKKICFDYLIKNQRWRFDEYVIKKRLKNENLRGTNILIEEGYLHKFYITKYDLVKYSDNIREWIIKNKIKISKECTSEFHKMFDTHEEEVIKVLLKFGYNKCCLHKSIFIKNLNIYSKINILFDRETYV